MPLVCNIFDAYERRARLYPMVLVIMPVVYGIASWVPPSLDLPALAGSAVLGIATAAVLTQMARDQGKKKEPKLFELWGGKPSVRALSYAGGFFAEATLKRYHANLARLDPNFRFPLNAQDEVEAPEKFQTVYQSANDILLGRTRDRQEFRLVFEENVNYGYRRNLWAMKATGIAMAALALAAGASRLITDAKEDGPLCITAIAALLSPGTFWTFLREFSPLWPDRGGHSSGQGWRSAWPFQAARLHGVLATRPREFLFRGFALWQLCSACGVAHRPLINSSGLHVGHDVKRFSFIRD